MTWFLSSLRECKHLLLVICQCWTVPAALAARNTFLVRLLVASGGRNFKAMVGNDKLLPPSKLKASEPLSVLNTRIPPSPHAAARYLPSGANLTAKISLDIAASLMVSRGINLDVVVVVMIERYGDDKQGLLTMTPVAVQFLNSQRELGFLLLNVCIYKDVEQYFDDFVYGGDVPIEKQRRIIQRKMPKSTSFARF